MAGVVGDDIVINGLSFAISEPEPVLEEARAAAMAGRAGEGRPAGRRPLERRSARRWPSRRAAPAVPVVSPKAGRMAMAAAESMPIEAGERELTVSVTVTYRLAS